MSKALQYQQLRWTPLPSFCKHKELSSVLDHEEIRQWLCKDDESVDEVVDRRVQQEREAGGITFAIESEEYVIGFCGLIRYMGESHGFQTTTYIGREFWGSGISKHCKIVQAGLAAALNLDSYVVSVDSANQRSLRSMRKLYPNNDFQELHEAWVPRDAFVMRLNPEQTLQDAADFDSVLMQQVVSATPLGQQRLSQAVVRPQNH